MLGQYFNLQPADVKGPINPATDFWERYLLTMLYSVFEFAIPKYWNLAYFRALLFMSGSMVIVWSDEYKSWIFSHYGVTKVGLYYTPLEFIVQNQFLTRPIECVRGEDCELVFAMDDRFGIMDIVRKYATQLAQIDGLIQQNLMVSHTGYVFMAKSKKAADTIKEAFGRNTIGEPLVAIGEDNATPGKDHLLESFSPNVAGNYITDELLLARRNVLNTFLSLIGIPTANYDKKERLTRTEVERNNTESQAIVDVILANIQECFRKVNLISGLQLSVRKAVNTNNEIDSMGYV